MQLTLQDVTLQELYLVMIWLLRVLSQVHHIIQKRAPETDLGGTYNEKLYCSRKENELP